MMIRLNIIDSISSLPHLLCLQWFCFFHLTGWLLQQEIKKKRKHVKKSKEEKEEEQEQPALPALSLSHC